MTIGTALVVIAVLYFIDKYHLWKKAFLVCLIALGVGLVGAAGYYGRQTWRGSQEKKAQAEREKRAQAALEAQWKVVAEKPDWAIPSAPEGFILEDVAYAILYPIKADWAAKTEAWEWYRRSQCVAVGTHVPVNSVLHDLDLFSFESYDDRWLKGTNLPREAKQALWSAKVKECQLPSGSKNIKACLDRQAGTITDDPFRKLGGQLVSCAPKQEMVYLNSESETKN